MTFWILTAALTGLTVVYILTPLMRAKPLQLWGWGLIVALPLAALGLYTALGVPQLVTYSL